MAAGKPSARGLGNYGGPGSPDDLQAGMVEALKRPRGIIPEGLDDFSCDNFEQRCRHILAHVLKSRKVSGSGV
jgi:hypothetical protein